MIKQRNFLMLGARLSPALYGTGNEKGKKRGKIRVYVLLACMLLIFLGGQGLIGSLPNSFSNFFSGSLPDSSYGVSGTVSGEELSTETVLRVPIQGTIDRGNLNLLERSLHNARSRRVDVVVLEMNTPGGYIDAAKKMRNHMDAYPGDIVAYVRPDAISAGAYLALAADEIYMAPGSTMGAAEPRVMGEGTADEKILSQWEAEMQSLADRNGRNGDIAAAMVRQSVSIEGLVSSDELLTLNQNQALEVGYSEGIVDDFDGLLGELELTGASIVEAEKEIIEHFISWTTNPVVATLLLMIGFSGLVLEILTAGFGVAGALSLLSFTFYFSGHMMGGMAGYEALILFIAGLLLMMVEAFVPGFGVFGGGGLISTFVSIVLSANSMEAGIRMLLVAIFLTVIILFFVIRHLSRKGVLRRFILDNSESKEEGYVATESQEELVDKTGKALTPLRPAGSALIDDQRIDVVTEGDYIDQDSKIKVVQVEGSRVIVRKWVE